MKKLMFVYKPMPGKMDTSRNLSDIVEAFSMNYLVKIHATDRKKDGNSYILNNLDERSGCLVFAGGDGTLLGAVSVLIDTGIDMPLNYYPSGSTNDFARSIGFLDNMREVAQTICNDKCQHYDIGKFNDSNFVYAVAFGLFIELSYKTDQEFKNILGHTVYIVSGIINLNLNDIIAYFMTGNNECEAVINFTALKLEIISEQEVDRTLDVEYGGNIKGAVIENLHNKVCFRK